jgi:hypothetical protein
MSGAAPIRLHLLPEALDRDGEPRAALVVPPSASRYGRRSITLLFPSIAAAVAAKRSMEAATPAGRDRPRR